MVDRRDDDSWIANRKYVLQTLHNMEEHLDEITTIVVRMDKEWSYLKGKLAVLGALSGTAAALVVNLLVKILSKV